MNEDETQLDGETPVMRTAEEKLCAMTKDYLSDRSKWEERQDIFYKMRHHGLRRKRMPFPNAADLHYPLIDTAIEKLTPFYLQQFSGAALLADFIATDGVSKNDTMLADQAARYFDYFLKNKTNFEDEHEPLIDSMLLSGRSILKIRWDESGSTIDYEVLDPLFFIVPSMTKQLQKAEFVTEVLQFSPSQYREVPMFRHDEEFMKRLLVKGDENGDSEETNDQKYIREGITQPKDNMIVVWQTYRKEWVEEKFTVRIIDEASGAEAEIEKVRKVKRVKVYTYAPHMPDMPVRDPFVLPYPHNEYPFVDFPREGKEKRWYAPRGVAERLAPFEAYLCKVWNEKADAMTFYNSPIYTTNGGSIPNPSNMKFVPGSVFQQPVSRVVAGEPPVSFDQEMINTRVAAESLEQVPDFGMGKQTDMKERRTATEIQAIASLSSASQDARAGLFRKRLKMVYRQSWSLLREFGKDLPLDFIHDRIPQQASREILSRNFEVSPTGAANSWNKQYHAQIALQLLQIFRGDPDINQIALKKLVVENLSPEHLAELIIDPIHGQIIRQVLQELQQFEAQNGPVPPQAKQQALATIQEHFNAIKTANPQAAQQLAMELGQSLQQQQQAPQALPGGQANGR